MIALDFDGVVANYGDHINELRFNDRLFAILPSPQPVAICTNQGGMAFSLSNPAKYPSPERVAERLIAGCMFLLKRGFSVQKILVSAYHPRADIKQIEHVARQLRLSLSLFPCIWHVYTTERSRKPSPLMLRACGATVFYGDSPEDGQSAKAAGIPFVLVERFV